MIKKIKIKQLKLGMYLNGFCAAWLDHPFWKTQFLIVDAEDLRKILLSNVDEVLIDTSKGLDVVVENESEADIQPEAVPIKVDQPLRAVVTTTHEQELIRAVSICRESKRAVMSMFDDVRLGKAIDTASARGVVDEITESVSRNSGALISLARLKTADDYTYMHSVAVCALMVALATQLGLDEGQK